MRADRGYGPRPSAGLRPLANRERSLRCGRPRSCKASMQAVLRAHEALPRLALAAGQQARLMSSHGDPKANASALSLWRTVSYLCIPGLAVAGACPVPDAPAAGLWAGLDRPHSRARPLLRCWGLGGHAGAAAQGLPLHALCGPATRGYCGATAQGFGRAGVRQRKL